MNNKQKKIIRAEAQRCKATIQIGKNGITPAIVQTIEQALFSHEIVKVHILQSVDFDKTTFSEEIKKILQAEYSFIIGRQLVLYKASSEKKNQEISIAVNKLV